MSGAGALRRSLVVWGWGQVAAGDRRGWLLPPLQVAAAALLAVFGPRLATGSALPMVVVSASAVVGAWGAVAVHAYRTASRRRAMLDLPPAGSGAVGLLSLAPAAIAASSILWAVAGQAADAGSVLDAYLRAWRASDAPAASRWLVAPPPAGVLADAWERQLTALRNELLRLSPQAGDDPAFDPDAPLDTVRWVAAPEGGPDGSRTISIEVARNETDHAMLFGLVPVTSQRLVAVATLGSVRLRAEPVVGPWVEWRIERVEVKGIALGE